MGRGGKIGLMLVAVAAGLFLLGYYLFDFDYGFGPRRFLPLDRPESADLRLAARGPSGPVRRGGPCPVTLTLTSNADRRITIVDIAVEQGLFGLDLSLGGAAVPPVAVGPERRAPWNSLLDAKIDLLPGTSYSRTFDLSRHYRFANDGEYALAVRYDPEAYFANWGVTEKKTAGMWLGRTAPAEVKFRMVGE